VRTHVDLFSGIGGFSLAAVWAGVKTIAFAEIDPYASRVIERHFPGVRNYGDVRNVPALDAWLVTGGVPCQPASVAGKRRGAEDDRWLWPEAIAAIERIKPTWVCLENPLGILSLEQPRLSLDLEGYGNLVEAAVSSEDNFWPYVTGEVEFIFRDLIAAIEKLRYEVKPIIIPACGVGAWHRRYRVWIMGHATRLQSRNEKQPPRIDLAGHSGPESLSDAHSAWQLQPQRGVKKQRRRRGSSTAFTSNSKDTNGRRANGTHHTGRRNSQVRGCGESDGRIQHWAVEPDVGRVAHGIPARLDRLKGLGNAIVPQVAYQLIKRMIEAEDAENVFRSQ
jgi:DNA (cytosine-5)-methyltransferase 1